MMRPSLLLPLLLAPLQAAAWEFSPTPLCTLSHGAGGSHLEITFDPAGPEYRLAIDLATVPWADSPVFGMAFRGGGEITITTDRHLMEGPRLSVSDGGFGNVLDGLQFNSTATAFTESQAVSFSLTGAQGPVRAFRACAEGQHLSGFGILDPDGEGSRFTG